MTLSPSSVGPVVSMLSPSQAVPQQIMPPSAVRVSSCHKPHSEFPPNSPHHLGKDGPKGVWLQEQYPGKS